jgi:hypothetical protein
MYDYQSSPTVNLKFRFCVSQCNPDVSLQFLGTWRPILRSLLNHVASIYNKKPRKILLPIIESNLNVAGNKLQFIMDFFGVTDIDPTLIKSIENEYVQVRPLRKTPFFLPKRYDELFEEDAIIFMVVLVIECLERIKTWSQNLKERGYIINTVVVMILDNCSFMNEIDWRFYLELVQHAEPCLQNLIILLNVEKQIQFIKPLKEQDISGMGLAIHEFASNFYQKEMKAKEAELFTQVVNLDPLSEDSIEDMLLDLSEIYSKQTLDEIERMVEKPENQDVSRNFIEEMLDRSNPNIVKSNGNQELLRSQLSWKHQVMVQYRKIEPEVIKYITQVTHGNPLMVMSYFQGLLTKGYLDVVKDVVCMTPKLKASLEYDHFSSHFQQPYEIENTTSVLIDKKLTKISKDCKSAFEFLALLYTLRVSALIGRQFNTQVLKQSGLCPASYK